jgi:hypothetical protein
LNEKEFIKDKAADIKKKLKVFPSDFAEIPTGKKLHLPDKTLVPGKEFFGSMEITTLDGELWHLSEDPWEGKYIIYSRQNGNREIIIPENKKQLQDTVAEYEKYLDHLMKEIGKDFKKYFPESGDTSSAVSGVFRMLNLVRY